MDQTTNYLQILDESLAKKLTVLAELISLTDEQTEVLKAEAFDEDAFNDLVVEKGELIEKLEQLDEGFQLIYDRVSEQLGENPKQYSEDVQKLQVKIRMILDQSTSLERKEASNKSLVVSKFAALKKEVRQVRKSRDSATNYYKSMNRISEAPVFMDTKK